MAKYDLPANVKFVLEQTKVPTISYIGHSQGTTQAFAGFSLFPELQEKVRHSCCCLPLRRDA